MKRTRALARTAVSSALYRIGVTRPDRAAHGKLTVATFHRVLPGERRAEYPLPQIVATPEELDAYLGFFVEHYACGPLDEIATRFFAGERTERPWLAITFDDGQLDNFEHALPVLRRRGVRASFFIPTEAIDTQTLLWHDRLGYAVLHWLRRAPIDARAFLLASEASNNTAIAGSAIRHAKLIPARAREAWIAEIGERAGASVAPSWDAMMTWGQVAELARDGHEIGSHSVTHPILPTCTEAELEREVAGSRAAIAERLGSAPVTFCYPNGDADARVAAAVQRSGYRWGVTTRWGTNAEGGERYLLRRCDIDPARTRGPSGAFDWRYAAWRFSGLHPGLGNA